MNNYFLFVISNACVYTAIINAPETYFRVLGEKIRLVPITDNTPHPLITELDALTTMTSESH